MLINTTLCSLANLEVIVTAQSWLFTVSAAHFINNVCAKHSSRCWGMLTAGLTWTCSDKTTATRRPSRGRRHQLTLYQYDAVIVLDFFFFFFFVLQTSSRSLGFSKYRLSSQSQYESTDGETSDRPFSFGMKETPRCVPLLLLELEGNIVPWKDLVRNLPPFPTSNAASLCGL